MKEGDPGNRWDISEHDTLMGHSYRPEPDVEMDEVFWSKLLQYLAQLPDQYTGRLIAHLLTERGIQLGKWHIQSVVHEGKPVILCKVGDDECLKLICSGHVMLKAVSWGLEGGTNPAALVQVCEAEKALAIVAQHQPGSEEIPEKLEVALGKLADHLRSAKDFLEREDL